MNNPRQAIKTVEKSGGNGNKYILVSAYAGLVRVPWDHSLNIEQNHYEAGMKLAKKYGWDKYNDYVIGSLSYDYVLVAIEKKK